MRFNHLFSTVLATSLAVTAPTLLPSETLAHAGHGDEFTAPGAVFQVLVDEELDGQRGVETNAIAEVGPAESVLVPSSAIVMSENEDGTEAPFVFVKKDNMYTPMAVTVGEDVDGAIAITDGLAVGDEIVTAGTLVLYAESRKAYDAHELEHAAAAAGGASRRIKRIAKGLIVFAFGALVGGGAVIVATRNPDEEDELESMQDETPQGA